MGADLPDISARSIPRTVRLVLAVAVASAVTFTLAPSLASADDLDTQRQRLTAQLSQSQQDLGESSQQLDRAAGAVESAQLQLGSAQRQLATTRTELKAAKAKDAAVAVKLRATQHQLALARAAVVTGQRALNAEKAMAAKLARNQYQQQSNLLPIAVLLSGQTTTDLQTQLQWSTTMFDTTTAQIDRLTVLQQALTVQRARQAALEKQLTEDRQAAAKTLRTKVQLERRAVTETASVAALLRQRAQARSAAAVAVAMDRQQVRDLNQERSDVDHRIAVRIAQAKAAAAAAARKAAVARAARLAAARRTAAAHRAHQAAVAKRARAAAATARAKAAAQLRADRAAAKRHHTVVRHSSPKKSTVKKHVVKKHVVKKHVVKKHVVKKHVVRKKARAPRRSGAHHGFIYPVNGPFTSPYGRRFHPILHVWKLHDGTDIGASCGTPIRAAYSGRVAERYFSHAYGNRLMIDHGRDDGRYVTTGYNHAQRYKVHVGQHVRQGQVVGYVGATGYATGCHLHLMVWLNGHRVNPMSWY